MKLKKIIASIRDDFSIKGYYHHPVHLNNNGWYYYTECWADIVGPYKTKKLAVDALHEYASRL